VRILHKIEFTVNFGRLLRVGRLRGARARTSVGLADVVGLLAKERAPECTLLAGLEDQKIRAIPQSTGSERTPAPARSPGYLQADQRRPRPSNGLAAVLDWDAISTISTHRGSISTKRGGRRRRHPPSHRGWFPTTGATVNGRREKRPPVRSRLGLRAVPLPRLLGTAITHLLPRLVTRCGRVTPGMGIRRTGASRKKQALNLKTDLI